MPKPETYQQMEGTISVPFKWVINVYESKTIAGIQNVTGAWETRPCADLQAAQDWIEEMRAKWNR